eukprot:gene4517-3304_t
MLKGLVDPSRELTEEQQTHIDTLQNEIDEIWNRRGDYKIDPDAWENMPIFMDHISEEDVEKNDSCRALASIVYDEVPPDEIAENRKNHGNNALRLALNPTQERRENLARAACHSYTEALQAKGKDAVLSSTIYANRSLAQFIIGNYGHGLEDAQRAIILNPNYHKAYYRAAKCAERVRKYDLAIDLLRKGRSVEPPLDSTALQEFKELEDICVDGKNRTQQDGIAQRRKTQAKAAKISNIAHAITSLGVKISPMPEVTSEQMGVYGNPQPYLDEDSLLHVPVLFMYDEYNQTDIMQDVACDVSIEELLDELLPFPWDDQGRYSSPDNIVAFYKIDDGVHMPEYYEIDKSWPLMEVFRTSTYKMPKLLPVIHFVCKNSELLRNYKIGKPS